MKKIGDSNTNNKSIHLGYKNGMWYKNMCHANNEKPKRQKREGIGLSNQEKIRMAWEKETYN